MTLLCLYTWVIGRVGFLDTLPLPYWESKTPCLICPETFEKGCEYFLLGVRESGPNYVQVVREIVSDIPMHFKYHFSSEQGSQLRFLVQNSLWSPCANFESRCEIMPKNSQTFSGTTLWWCWAVAFIFLTFATCARQKLPDKPAEGISQVDSREHRIFENAVFSAMNQQKVTSGNLFSICDCYRILEHHWIANP